MQGCALQALAIECVFSEGTLQVTTINKEPKLVVESYITQLASVQMHTI